MTEFVLDERLARRPVAADWPLSTVLFVDDARFPWVILVPRVAGVTEIHELSAGDQAALIGEVARASRALKAAFPSGKDQRGGPRPPCAPASHPCPGPQQVRFPCGRTRFGGPGEREPHSPVPYGDPRFGEALEKLRAALDRVMF